MTEDRTATDWRKLANLRQFMIDKLEEKNRRLQSSLDSANARLALYDMRERA